MQFEALIKKIERDLYKVNSDFSNVSSLKSQVSSIYSSLEELEKILEDKESEAFFVEKFKETNLISLLKQLGSNLGELKKFSESFEEKDLRLGVLLERYRTLRSYYFLSIEKSFEFVSQMHSLFSVDFFVFKPNFIGLMDLDELSKTFSIEMESKQSLKVSPAQLKQLIDLMVSKSKFQAFRLESSELKVFWKSPQTVSVETSNEKLKRIDFLAKSVGGNFSEY